MTPHLVAHVDFGEAEGAEVRVGALHCWLNGLSEQLVHKLADEWPHLLHCLGRRWWRGGEGAVDSQSNQTKQVQHIKTYLKISLKVKKKKNQENLSLCRAEGASGIECVCEALGGLDRSWTAEADQCRRNRVWI